jgi:spermidine synthase
VDALQARLQRPEYKAVADSLREVGYNSIFDLLSTYAAQASDLHSWLRNAQINRDRNLRLQYLAGMGLNEYLAPMIYEQILQQSRFPNEIFSGAPASLRALQVGMNAPRY